jgi:hypothetical protein
VTAVVVEGGAVVGEGAGERLPPPPRGRRGAPGALRRLAELLALTAFALAQPVLDVTGRSPDFFLYRRPSAWDLRLLVLLVALAPPLLLWGAERLAGLVSEVAERGLHLAFTALLFAAVAIQAGKHAGLFTGLPLGVLGVAAGGGLAVLAARSARFRDVLRYAAPAPLVFVLLFAFTTPSGALVRPGRGGAAAGPVAANRPPIVFLFLDEFPLRALLDERGRIDARLFPNFARLAAASTWYPNATGVAGWTPYAVPAMLSGTYPERAAAPSYLEYPENLFTLLAGTYDVKAYETISQLCPPTVCSDVPAGRPTGLRALVRDTVGVAREVVSPYPPRAEQGNEFVEQAAAEGAARRGEESPMFRFGEVKSNQPERFTSFLAGLEPTAQPRLSFLHLLLPHSPYRYLPSGRGYPLYEPEFGLTRMARHGVLRPETALAQHNMQRLLFQVGYLDQLLGQLLDRMRETGLWDQALLVVTADHGSGLAGGSRWRKLDELSTPDLAWVPLFVRTPGQRAGAVDRRNEEHVDLLPTIADVLGVTVPWEVDGRSVLGEPRRTAVKRWFDDPGKPKPIDGAKWAPALRSGIAAEVSPGARSPKDLFRIGTVAPLVGKRVDELAVGAPADVVATLDPGADVAHVRLGSPSVPALLWGDLDRPVGDGPTWLAASVNGRVAGGLVAMRSDRTDRWHFLGIVDDELFKEGANDVVLYTYDGAALHPIRWAP